MSQITENFANQEISLLDIWHKLVLHKKLFWTIFILIIVIGSCLILFIPKRHSFTQVVEIGSYLNSTENLLQVIEQDKAAKKIKTLFYPQILKSYLTKASPKDRQLIAKASITVDGADDILNLTITGKPEFKDNYIDILNGIVALFIQDSDKNINTLKKNYVNLKRNLEKRLAVQNEMLSKFLVHDSNENNLLSLYLIDKRTDLEVQLSEVKTKLDSITETKALGNISENVVGPPKIVLFVLILFIALFMSLFVVLLSDFFSRIK